MKRILLCLVSPASIILCFCFGYTAIRQPQLRLSEDPRVSEAVHQRATEPLRDDVVQTPYTSEMQAVVFNTITAPQGFLPKYQSVVFWYYNGPVLDHIDLVQTDGQKETVIGRNLSLYWWRKFMTLYNLPKRKVA